MAKRRLQNLRAIVTGASSGIGWQLSLQLASAGVHVLAVARRDERLQRLVTEIRQQGGRCDSVTCDITLPESRKLLLEACRQQLGGLDLLVNNAGVGAMGPFAEASPERLRTIFEVNFFAAAELIRSSLPLLKNGRQPLIVNMGSILGHFSVPLKSEYCAAKFAIRGLTDSLRSELADDGIDLLLVSPGTTDSEFFESALEDNTGKNWKSRGAMPPDQVARLTMNAIQKGNREIILSWGGKWLVWLHRWFPNWASNLVGKYAR